MYNYIIILYLPIIHEDMISAKNLQFIQLAQLLGNDKTCFRLDVSIQI